MRNQLIMFLSISVLAAACGKSESSEPAQAEAPPTIEDSVIGAPLNRALERARGVEATVQQQAEEQRRKIEEAER